MKKATIVVGLVVALAACVIGFIATRPEPEPELIIPEILTLRTDSYPAVSQAIGEVEQLSRDAYEQYEERFGSETSAAEEREFLQRHSNSVNGFVDGIIAIPDDRALIEGHVEHNLAAIRATDQLLKYDSFPELNDDHSIIDLSNVLQARLCRAGLEAANGDSSSAIADVIAVLKLSRNLTTVPKRWYPSRGLLLSEQSLRVAIRLLAESKISEQEAASVLFAAAETAPTPETLANAIRQSFAVQVRFLEAMKQDSSETCRAIITLWLEQPKYEEALETRLEMLEALLEYHPNPWDQLATRQLFIEQAVLSVNSFLADSGKGPAPAPVVKEWPDELSLLPTNLLSLVIGPEDLPQSLDLETHQRAIKQIPNVLGKHILSTTNTTFERDRSLRCALADRRCWTVVLACMIYKKKTGQLPKTLDAVVSAGLLESIPNDPFGKELKFDPKRGAVWSIGPNRKDDGGIRIEWDEKDDRVRRIGVPTAKIYTGE